MFIWSVMSLLWLMLGDMAAPPLTMSYRVLAPAGLFRVWTDSTGWYRDTLAFNHATKRFDISGAANFFGPDERTADMHTIAADEAQRLFIKYGGDVRDF